MAKVAVTIDDWKLTIFSDHLRADGFQFENKGYLCAGVLLLRVETDDTEKLKGCCMRATIACRAVPEDQRGGKTVHG